MQAGATGPRFLDPHQKAKVQHATLNRYRSAFKPFLLFLIKHNFVPISAAEFDDLLVEYKYLEEPTRSTFEGLIAAVEFVMPLFKGHLTWARAVLDGWNVAHVPAHTTPMTSGPAALFAVHLAAEGKPRLGVGVVLQQRVGLRPSEMLALLGRDVTFPEENFGMTRTAGAKIGLGMKTGTKAKRAQTVLLKDEDFLALLRWVKAKTANDELLFPVSYESYRRCLRRLTLRLKLDIKFTPHSPRAGFASECIARGKPLATTKELGRW